MITTGDLTSHAIKSFKRSFKKSFDGKTLSLYILWLRNSDGLPKDVKDVVEYAIKREYELAVQRDQRH